MHRLFMFLLPLICLLLCEGTSDGVMNIPSFDSG